MISTVQTITRFRVHIRMALYFSPQVCAFLGLEPVLPRSPVPEHLLRDAECRKVAREVKGTNSYFLSDHVIAFVLTRLAG